MCRAAARRSPSFSSERPEAEVGVVVRRMALHDGRELARRVAVAAAAEVRAAERLADRGLVGLQALCLLERHGRLRPVALRDQRRARAGRGRMPRGRSSAPAFSCCCCARPARRSWTKSSTRVATSSLELRGTCSSPGAPDDHDLVLVGVEADVGPGDVVHDDRVEALARELVPGARRRPRARARRRSRRSTGPRAAHRAASDEHVGGRDQVDGQRVAALLGDLVVERALGPEVRHRGGHQQQVGLLEAGQRRIAQLRGRADRHVGDARECGRARCWRRSRSRRRRGAPPRRRARIPSGRWSGCRRSAPSRAARASRRR